MKSRIIKFALPGVMSRKILKGNSDYIDTPEGAGMHNAVTKKELPYKTHKIQDDKVMGGYRTTKTPDHIRKRGISHDSFYIKATENGRDVERPIRAHDYRDPDLYGRAKQQVLIAESKSDLEREHAKVEWKPDRETKKKIESGSLTIEDREHIGRLKEQSEKEKKKITKNFIESRRNFIPKVPQQVNQETIPADQIKGEGKGMGRPKITYKATGEIPNTRRAIAGEVRQTRNLIGGLKKHLGIDGRIPITPALSKAVGEAKAKLPELTENIVQGRHRTAARAQSFLTKRIETGLNLKHIGHTGKSYEPNDLRHRVSTTMEPMSGTILPAKENWKEHYSTMADAAEIKSVGRTVKQPNRPILSGAERLGAFHRRLDRFASAGSKTYRAQIEKKVIDPGVKGIASKLFTPHPVAALPKLPTSFPILKKAGIAAGAVAAGALAAGFIRSKRKKPEQELMSRLGGMIQLAVTGKPFQDVLKKAIKMRLKDKPAKYIVKNVADLGDKKPNINDISVPGVSPEGMGGGARIKAETMLRYRAGRAGRAELRQKGTSPVEQIDANSIRATRTMLARDVRAIRRVKRVDRQRESGPSLIEAHRHGVAEGIEKGRAEVEHMGQRPYFNKELKRIGDDHRQIEGQLATEYADKIHRIKNSQRSKIVKTAAISGTAGATAGVIATKPKKDDKVSFGVSDKDKPSSLHDILTGGVEGGVGVLATDKLINHEGGLWDKIRSIGSDLRSPLQNKIPGKFGKGALVGAAATGLIGAGISAITHKKPTPEDTTTTQFSYPGEVWGNEGLTGKVSKDRFKKKIAEQEYATRDSNAVRASLAGALAGAAFKHPASLGRRVAVGAGAGLLASTATRVITSGSKDIYGERSHDAKSVDSLPQKVLAGTAAVFGARRLRGGTGALKGKFGAIKTRFGLAAKLQTIMFDDVNDFFQGDTFRSRRRPKEIVQAEKYWKWGKRAGNLAGDLKSRVTGKPNLDERGREKRSELSKPWVKNAAGIAILGATLASVKGVRSIATAHPDSSLGQVIQAVHSGKAATAVANRFPKVGKVINTFRKNKAEATSEVAGASEGFAGKVAKWINKNAAGNKPVAPSYTIAERGGRIVHAPEGSEAAEDAARKAREAAAKRLRKKSEGELSDRSKLIKFDYYDTGGFDIRDPRGNSIRVFKDGKPPRIRRPKRWYEKEDNKRVLTEAALGGSLVTGTAIGASIKKQPIHHVAHEATSGAHAINPLYNDIIKSAIKIKKSDTQPLVTLSRRLDRMICT